MSDVAGTSLENAPDFLKKLWRRRVVRFGGLYLGASWLLLQLAMALEDSMQLPDWVYQTTLALVVIGFPLVTQRPQARKGIFYGSKDTVQEERKHD